MKEIKNSYASSYGILRHNKITNAIDVAAEQIQNLGYAIIDSGYTKNEMIETSRQFDAIRNKYITEWGEDYLKEIDEYYTVRLPMAYGGNIFIDLSCNKNILGTVQKLIEGKFILNQQNLVINPPEQTYNQGMWHRDLPYQHYTSSTPLAINALYCVDDFTNKNGGTFVLSASHKSENFPSNEYIKNNEIQIQAKAGSIIVLDCMLFHKGGFNNTNTDRRGINHVYTIPYFKQQINMPSNVNLDGLDPATKELFGVGFTEPGSVNDYFLRRKDKT